MKTAYLYLRHKTDSRYQLFSQGLKKHGFSVVDGLPPSNPGPEDIFVTWNRLSAANAIALQFEARGQTVLVAENCSLGNDFNGEKWFHVTRTRHNTAGLYPVGGTDRWDDLAMELKPFRDASQFPETVILPQRGIGSPPTVMPRYWPQKALKHYGGRVRAHPGKNEKNIISLEKDLKRCGKVVVWGSGAGIKALTMGIPVVSEMPDWIGQQDNTEAGRLRMFRELIWAQWRHEEIQSGFCFERLLCSP